MPNNSWDAAFDAARHNPEQAALTAWDKVIERASCAGVHEAYDAMRQKSGANQSDNQTSVRMSDRMNGAGATALTFQDGSRIEALLGGNGAHAQQHLRDSRGLKTSSDVLEHSVRFLSAPPTEPGNDAVNRQPVEGDRTQREQQDPRIEASRRRLEVAAYSAFNPREREAFLENMRTFEGRLGSRSPDEVTRSYDALTRMITGEGLTADSLNPENRYALARNFMYHAAEPTNIDQGIFNTCNVTTMQEGLFASRPSVMADMLAQASLTGTYRSPHDGRVTRLDRNSMMPVPGSEHPNADQGERSYATQLLNHVMVNEISQRRIPPQFYSQITRTGDRNDNGERLTTGGFTGNEVLFNGRVARQPVITIADMGAAMQRYGRPDSVFYNSTATGWEHPSVVTFRNVEEMTRRITERIASGAPVIMYIRDVSGLPRGQGGPDTPHVISITGIRPDGVVSFSNQWGRHGDGSMRIEDLFRISRGRT